MDIDTSSLELFVGTKEYIVENTPVGLLMLEDGCIICKSEYRTEAREGMTCHCTIVSSGENYCGGDEKKCISLQIQ